jgi:hypothetical protein
MKKTTLAIGIGLIGVAVAIWFLLPQRSEAPVPTEPTEMNAPTTADEARTGVATLAELSQGEGRLECAVQYRASAESEEITGTYFVDSGRVRGDFVLNDPTLGEIVTSVIVNSETLYVWSLIDGERYGVQAPATGDEAVTGLPIPPDESVRYSCTPWTEYDGSIFNPPSDVLFRDAMDTQAEFGTIYEEGEF